MNETNSSATSFAILCEMAAYLAGSHWLRGMYILRICISILGICLFGVLFKIQGQHLTAVHSNARLLLVSHHVWAIAQCIASIFGHAFDLIIYSVHQENPCDYLSTTILAIIVRGPGIIALYGQVFALATMAVERTVATLNYESYEYSNDSFGKVLVLSQWLLAILSFCSLIFDLNWAEMKSSLTIVSQRNGPRIANLLSSLAAMELVALGVFYSLLHFNIRRKTLKREAPLTERYQIDENIRAIRLMIPMIWTHFCCFMPTLVGFPLYLKMFPGLNPRDYTLFGLSFHSAPLYTVILPPILLWRHNILRQNLRRAMGIQNAVLNSEPRNDGRTYEQMQHFEALKIAWMISLNSRYNEYRI